MYLSPVISNHNLEIVANMYSRNRRRSEAYETDNYILNMLNQLPPTKELLKVSKFKNKSTPGDGTVFGIFFKILFWNNSKYRVLFFLLSEWSDVCYAALPGEAGAVWEGGAVPAGQDCSVLPATRLL